MVSALVFNLRGLRPLSFLEVILYATLYKKGSSATVRGIKCDFKQFLVSQIPKMEVEGWTTDLNSLKSKTRKTSKPRMTGDDINPGLDIEAKKDEPS